MVWVPEVGSVAATVSTNEKPATCTEDGSVTYTATVTVGDETYEKEKLTK